MNNVSTKKLLACYGCSIQYLPPPPIPPVNEDNKEEWVTCAIKVKMQRNPASNTSVTDEFKTHIYESGPP